MGNRLVSDKARSVTRLDANVTCIHYMNSLVICFLKLIRWAMSHQIPSYFETQYTFITLDLTSSPIYYETQPRNFKTELGQIVYLSEAKQSTVDT